MISRLKRAELKLKVWMLAVVLIVAGLTFLWPSAAERTVIRGMGLLLQRQSRRWTQAMFATSCRM